MKTIKTLMAVLLGLGIIFIGGESVALSGRAVSVGSTVSSARVGITGTGVRVAEIEEVESELDDTSDGASSLGESSIDSDAGESTGDLDADVSATDPIDSRTGADPADENDGSSGDGVSSITETDTSSGATEEVSDVSSEGGDSSEASDSTESSLDDSSLVESSMGEPAETGDSFPIGVVGITLVSIGAGALMVLGKKED